MHSASAGAHLFAWLRGHSKSALSFCKLLAKILLMVLIGIAICLHGLVIAYKWINPPVTNMMLLHWWKSPTQRPLYSLRDDWIPLEQISPYILIATLAAEDPFFFQHRGFYIADMWEALKHDLAGKKLIGSSTITQQTVKNIFLHYTQSYWRKIIELYLTALVELIWGKERILEIYLNILELANDTYGIENGAQHHFAKPASKLCFDEACLLMSILTDPKHLDPLNPNNFVSFKSALVFKKGFAAARKAETDVPCLSGHHRLY